MVVVIVVISGVKRGTLQGRYERKILVAAKKRCSYHSSLSITVLLLLLLLFGPKAVQRCQWCHSVVSLLDKRGGGKKKRYKNINKQCM